MDDTKLLFKMGTCGVTANFTPPLTVGQLADLQSVIELPFKEVNRVELIVAMAKMWGKIVVIEPKIH